MADINKTVVPADAFSTVDHDEYAAAEAQAKESVGNYTEQLFALCAAEDTAPSSNPMGIRADSKRRKKLMQKRLAMGYKA